MKQQCGLKICY